MSPKILKELRRRKGSGISIYGMSNIAVLGWEILKLKMNKEQLEVLDEVFISAVVHERKPNSAFYNYVISSGKLDVKHTLFIDDKREDVSTARTCGMHTMQWFGPDSL
ncbi:hypothetical protein BDQ17DRAFT_1332180 [Cyathus striatus]|nr:hypothetical protein BDQ17DRAFT_1332180 [Cyathus striatus]